MVDKPDLRYGMEMVDLDEIAKACDFAVFKGAVEAGGAVRAINVKGLGGLARKKIDARQISLRVMALRDLLISQFLRTVKRSVHSLSS